MMRLKCIETGVWYRAHGPDTLARRLWGRRTTVRSEHSTAFRPAYWIWTATAPDGTVMGRLYAEEKWREQDE